MVTPPRPSSLSKRPAPARKKQAVEVTAAPAGPDYAGQQCSICTTPISQGEMVVQCPFCKLPYHDDCWKEIGGCGNYGCQAVPETVKTETRSPDEFQDGWTAQKVCPVCRGTISAAALKCKLCRATFPHERPMTAEEYHYREYPPEELTKYRNLTILNFLLSAVGCLFFITLPHNLYLISSAEGTFISFRRLPPSLKMLVYASCVVSALWIFVIGFVFVFAR